MLFRWAPVLELKFTYKSEISKCNYDDKKQNISSFFSCIN